MTKNPLILAVEAELTRRLRLWDRITDWTSYSSKGCLLANAGMSFAILCGAEVPWSVIGIATGVMWANVLAHHLCMRRLKLLARAAYRVIGPCNNPDCLACRTLGSL